MITVDIVDFIRTGRMGPIGLGSPHEDVLAYIGEPESRTVPSLRPVILRYGRLQIQIAEDRVSALLLAMIAGPHPSYPSLVYKIPPELEQSNTTITQSVLKTNGIEAVLDPKLTSVDQHTLVVPASGVRLVLNQGLLETIYVG